MPKAARIVPRLNLSNAFNKRIPETALTAPLLSSFNIELIKSASASFTKRGIENRKALPVRTSNEKGSWVTDGPRSRIPEVFDN